MSKTVFVIGLGLIGASLAKTMTISHPEHTVYGWDTKIESTHIAKKSGIITQVAPSVAEVAPLADIIILAGPIHTTMQYLHDFQQLTLKPDVLVTDVGSTKYEIATYANMLPFDFIGGHPMAGSHKSGVLAADTLLFENAYFIFTPTSPSQQKRVNELVTLYQETKAKFIVLSPLEHDQITGMLSHLPHIIASGIVNQSDGFNQAHPRAKQLAAGGFRDITRIASSDPVIWTDILLSNRTQLMDLITTWQIQMQQVYQWLDHKDRHAIHHFFESAKETRDAMPIHQPGAIPRFYDLLIDVPDEPGVIATVTAKLAQANISLTNIKILETREDIIGILQVSFKHEADLFLAKDYLTQHTTYPCRIKE